MRTISLVLTLLFASPWCAAQELPSAAPADAGLSAEKLERVGPAVQALIDKKQVMGALVGVARRGKVAYLKAFGVSDASTAAPLKPDAIFRIYSMSKPITSVAVMMLVEEGRVALDDPISRHLPEFKELKVYASGAAPDWKLVEPERAVTVRDLMRHTAGMSYGFFSATPVDALFRERKVLDPGQDLASMTKTLSTIPLLYQPGTKFHYSVSVDVQGRLVEVLSGKPFDEFLQERIFGPLDMKDTGFWVPAEKLDRLATNYGPGGVVVDKPERSPYRAKPKLLSGGGGLVSTARDYLRFCQMILNGGELGGKRLLRRETVEQMTVNQLPESAVPIGVGPTKQPGVGFGLGFSVRVKEEKGKTGPLGECAWGGAASTHFWLSPKHGLAVVALEQHMPFTPRLQEVVKLLVYDALAD